MELRPFALYARGVLRSLAPGRSPTPGLILGLIITLAAVVAYSGYIAFQISGLRELQNNLVDRNRKDSLQLLRIQNDLNSVGLAMRDMLDADEPYPLTAWSAQFQRVRADLNDALRLEERRLAASHGRPQGCKGKHADQNAGFPGPSPSGECLRSQAENPRYASR